jgi:hypothetical protein
MDIMQMRWAQPEPSARPIGTRDGEGAGDHDQSYRFGFRPRAEWPYPFSTRQYARLLVLRSRLRETNDPQSELEPVRCLRHDRNGVL